VVGDLLLEELDGFARGHWWRGGFLVGSGLEGFFKKKNGEMTENSINLFRHCASPYAGSFRPQDTGNSEIGGFASWCVQV